MRTRHLVSSSGILGRALGVSLQVAGLLVTLDAVTACGSKSTSAGVAPAITTPPASVTVPDGAVASFSVIATGDAPLAYQWRRNGVDLVDGAGINGATTPALALTAAIGLDKSLLSVRVSNGAGAVVSADAVLTVTAAAPAAPVISMQPNDAMVMAGTTATFAVATSGGTAPITYQWKRNGVAIGGATSATYTTPATLTSDTGSKYSVDVVNAVGTVPSNDALLTVIEGARTWGPVVEISGGDLNSAMQANGAVLAVDSTGAAVAAWQQASGMRNAAWGNHADASGTWSTAAPIDLPSGGNATPPSVAMTSGGSAIAVFGQPINTAVGQGLVASRFSGGVWTAAETIVAGDVDSVSSWQTGIASDGSAAATFLQTDPTMKRVRGVRSTSGDVWGTPVILDVAGGDVPKLATGANGHSVAVWMKNNGPAVSELWSSHDVGLGFQLASMITTDTSHANALEVTADAAGNVTAVWSQFGTSGNYVVRSARLDDTTGAWSAPASLSDGTRQATASKAAVNSKGDAAVVWYEQNGGLYASTYSATKATWTPAVQLPMTVAPTFAPLPTTTIDDGGNAIAVWLQYVNGAQFPRVFHSILIAGLGKWTTPATLMTDPTAYCVDAPAVSLNAKGFATAVWHQLTPSPATAPIVARAYR